MKLFMLAGVNFIKMKMVYTKNNFQIKKENG